jgi:DNA replication and repair protein RecF
MRLASLSIINFKNIKDLELSPSIKLTCITGNNGMGKTNLLDAIYLLSMCKSSTRLPDKQCIRHGEDFFLVKGVYDIGGDEESISCGVTINGDKSIKRSGKQYKRISEHLGLLPLVMISPNDISLIISGGEERRRYLNTIIVQVDKRYLNAINCYGAVLVQRNKLLKSYDKTQSSVLDAFDMQMAQYGMEVYEMRTKFVDLLLPSFQKYYEIISGSMENVSLQYVSDLQKSSMELLLKESRTKDIALQFTNVGIHRDELELKLNGYPVRRLGSQGQQKSVLLALKLAQAEVLRQALDIAPILLLDDIFDKLDEHRLRNLMHLLADANFGQIFLTDTNRDRIGVLLQSLPYESKLLEINDGQLL